MYNTDVKKKFLIFLLTFFIFASIASGCNSVEESTVPLTLVKVYHPPYYSFVDIYNSGVKSELLPYPSKSSELPLPSSEAYFRNKVIFEFNQDLAAKQDVPLFYINKGFTGLILPKGSRPRLEPFDFRYMNETYYSIDGNKITITDRIGFGIGLPVFLIPKGFKAKNGTQLDKDLLLYFSSSWKPKERDWELSSSATHIVPIPKRKGDGKMIGYTGLNNVPLLSEPDGKKVMNLFAGDSLEVLEEKGDWIKVRLQKREKEIEPPEEPLEPANIYGFIKKDQFIPLPDPLNEGSSIYTYSNSFEGEPYGIGIGVSTFPLGGYSVVLRPGNRHLFTSEDIGILEAYTLLWIADSAGSLNIGSCDKKSPITSFSDPRNEYPFMLLTNNEFKTAERFRVEYTNDLIKIVENFALPEELKSIKDSAISLINKRAQLVSIGESWAYKHKGKNEKELCRELADACGRSENEKNEIYAILLNKVYEPEPTRMCSFRNALNDLLNNWLIGSLTNQISSKISQECNKVFSP